jgi:hypothetical protein
MASNAPTSWTFLTSHARVLLCIAQDSGMRLREIGERVGITERAVHRIIGDLADAGYLSRERHGRRNRYTINSNLTLPDPVARRQRVGDLLAVLTEPSSWPPAVPAIPAQPSASSSPVSRPSIDHAGVGDRRSALENER